MKINPTPTIYRPTDKPKEDLKEKPRKKPSSFLKALQKEIKKGRK